MITDYLLDLLRAGVALIVVAALIAFAGVAFNAGRRPHH